MPSCDPTVLSRSRNCIHSWPLLQGSLLRFQERLPVDSQGLSQGDSFKFKTAVVLLTNSR